jgi:aspartyl-tRNA(Asn)/glutamyl-tRNA(Gln) amidotransferase subunit A
MSNELLSIVEARAKLDRKELSATELVDQCVKIAKAKDHELGAFLEVFDDVSEQAKAADTQLTNGKAGVLTGIPIALKDNIVQQGRSATAGSRILEGFVSPYDATVVTKLKEAGAILFGRTNLDEFAMGSSTEHSAFGATKNPHDVTRVPGGSSGGSAAAVASGIVPGALGSDTGGSIRQPASFCGVVGLKPTYGSVSRHGLIAMGSSLDVIGPIARTIEDTELLFNTICGRDALDSTSREGKYEQTSTRRVGVPRHFLESGVDEDVLARFDASIEELRENGYEIVDVELPRAKHALAVYYIIMPAEASTNLARYDGVRFGHYASGADGIDDYKKSRAAFGTEVRRRIILGTYVLSAGYYDAYYNKATEVRKLLTDDFTETFKRVDVIATPTTPTPAFTFGEKSDPLSMYLTDIFTVPANLSGMPAISVPSGLVTREGVELPVGVQFTAPHFQEERLFSVGKVLMGV